MFGGSSAAHGTDDQLTGQEEKDLEALLDNFKENVPARTLNAQDTPAVDVETGVPASESAMAFVCGYVAHKAGDRTMGAPSSQAEEVPLQALWLRLRSLGGLTIPTEAFLTEFRRMEECFSVHHALEPHQLSSKSGVIADFLKVLNSKFSTVPVAAQKAFARVRTITRLRTVNDARRQESLEKRAAKKRKQCAT